MVDPVRPPVLRLAFAGWALLWRQPGLAAWLFAFHLGGYALLSTVPLAVTGEGLTAVVVLLGLAVMSAMATTAVLRAVLRPRPSGGAPLGLGLDEVRQLGLLLLTWVMSVVGLFAALILLGMAVEGLEASSGSILSLVLFMLMLAAGAAVLARLALAGPATFADRRWRIAHAWKLAGPIYWRLLASLAIVSVIVAAAYLVGLVALGVIGGVAGIPVSYKDVWGGYSTLQEAVSLGRVLSWVISAAVGTAATALWTAVGAEAFRSLIGDGPQQTADIFA